MREVRNAYRVEVRTKNCLKMPKKNPWSANQGFLFVHRLFVHRLFAHRLFAHRLLSWNAVPALFKAGTQCV